MSLQTRKEKLDSINRRLKKKKYMAILLALFTLGVNAFAWFVFSTHSDFTYEGKVSSWDVELKEGGHAVNDFTISTDMEPGMTDFVKTYEISNHGEVDAKITYNIQSLHIMGRNVNLYAVSDPVDYLENFYPFSIQVTTDRTVVAPNGTATFTVTVSWDFEDSTAYYALNNVYDYDSGFTYYKYENNAYTEFAVVDTNYNSLRDTLYLNKDDADTYFGMKCGVYQASTNLHCLDAVIRLSVEQNNA